MAARQGNTEKSGLHTLENKKKNFHVPIVYLTKDDKIALLPGHESMFSQKRQCHEIFYSMSFTTGGHIFPKIYIYRSDTSGKFFIVSKRLVPMVNGTNVANGASDESNKFSNATKTTVSDCLHLK